MNFIGDFFAIGIVAVLLLFFFDRQHALTKASKYFIACLILTALTASTDLLTGYLMYLSNIPLWLNLLVNSAYFLTTIITTSCIGLYLFTRILEHSHNSRCMRNAIIGLAVLFGVFSIVVIANLWTGWLFYFDSEGIYRRGPFNAFGYSITICQMILVVICFFRNRQNASKSMRQALTQTFPVIILCIIIQRIFPEIMLNGYIMAMVDTVLFLTFQGQRPGVHSLTKLNDRHHFFKNIEDRMASGKPFQVFLINLKNYGAINRKYGHLQGDEILYQFAFSLESLIRNSTAFHMNGTVFALILPYRSQSEAETHCTVLLDYLEKGTHFLDHHILYDYIMVDYVAEQKEQDAETFYEQLEYTASIAYQKKCRYMRYTPDIGAEMKRKRYLAERIRTVDHEHGFETWYQPICCLSTGRFCSIEALIRLREPDGTIIPPSEFISIAEETGTISSITWFVIEDVCRFLGRHPELEDVNVSINLPMSQLSTANFVPRLNSLTNRFGINHKRICLEFTERELLDTFEHTKSVMETLTQEGYNFYLDDFGTGYSNFSNMIQLPFQAIKLDASLIRATEAGGGNYRLIRSVSKLSHDMGMQVVAEGVENPDTAEALGQQGVDRIQGYAFAAPMPEDEIIAFYQNNPL